MFGAKDKFKIFKVFRKAEASSKHVIGVVNNFKYNTKLKVWLSR